MSGGSLEYVHFKVEQAADKILNRADTPLETAFANHLYKVAEALHAVEWNYSGDWGPEKAQELIKVALGDTADSKAKEVLNKEARELIEKMEKYIKEES